MNEFCMSRSFDQAYSSVKQYVIEQGMQPLLSSGIAIALSGGADSVFLFHALRLLAEEWNFQLAALHVNHGIRGEEADRDARFCRELCLKWNVPFYLYTCSVPQMAKESKKGIEETARAERYSFFESFLAAHSEFSYVATAHHATDHAETLIFHMIRGSGNRGMCGIAPRRDNILRPLLSLTREEIRLALSESHIPYVTDTTNFDTVYVRNFIRERILPQIISINPSFEASALRQSACARADEAHFAQCVASILAETDGMHVPVERLKNADDAVCFRVLIRLYELCKKKDSTDALSYVQLEALVSQIRKQKKNGFRLDVSGGVQCICDGTLLYFISTPLAEKESEAFMLFLDLGENLLPDGTRFILSEAPDPYWEARNEIKSKIIAKTVISSDQAEGKLFLRSREAGDAYRYGGMTHKLKRMMNDAKFSAMQKVTLPILCDSKGILWIPGFPVRDGEKDQKKRKNKKIYVYYAYDGGENDA